MSKFSFCGRWLFLFLCAVFVFLSAPAMTQEAASAEGGAPAEESAEESAEEGTEGEAAPEEPPPPPETPEEARKRINQEAKEAADAFIAENFDHATKIQELAAVLDQKCPRITPPWTEFDGDKIPVPSFPVSAKIKDERDGLRYLEEKARKPKQEEYMRQHPQASEESIREAAQKKYKMYKVGDIVGKDRVILLRGGMGFNNTPSGRVTAISPERVRIDTRWVSRYDFDAETEALFYAEKNRDFVEDYVHREIRRYEAERDIWVNEALREVLPRIFMENYYVPKQPLRPNSEKIADSSQWILRRTYMEELYKNSRDRVYRSKLHQEKKTRFEGLGWVYVKEAKDWMPEAEAAKFQSEHK